MTRRFEYDAVFDAMRTCPQCGELVEQENEHTDLCQNCIEDIADANHITKTEAAICADNEYYAKCPDCNRPILAGYVQSVGGVDRCKDCHDKRFGKRHYKGVA